MSCKAGALLRDALAALALGLGCGAGCDPAASTWSPDGERIVFAYERGAGAALGSCDLPSGEVRHLFGGGEHRFLRPLFEESGERLVVLAVTKGVASACEVLRLTAQGEPLTSQRLAAVLNVTAAEYLAFVLPTFLDGGSLWLPWRGVEEPTKLAYRRFDLDRNELTDEALPSERLVLRRGEVLFSFDLTELDQIQQVAVRTRPLRSTDWSSSIFIDVDQESEDLAGLGALAVGDQSLAMIVRSEGREPLPFDLILSDLHDGAQRRLSIPDLGLCGDAVFGPGERELWVVAAKAGEVGLHRISTEDGATRSLCLFRADPSRPVPDERLARDVDVSISPDGTRLAVASSSIAHSVGQPDLFVYALGDELRTVGRYHAPR